MYMNIMYRNLFCQTIMLVEVILKYWRYLYLHQSDRNQVCMEPSSRRTMANVGGECWEVSPQSSRTSPEGVSSGSAFTASLASGAELSTLSSAGTDELWWPLRSVGGESSSSAVKGEQAQPRHNACLERTTGKAGYKPVEVGPEGKNNECGSGFMLFIKLNAFKV